MSIGLTYYQLRELSPCKESLIRVTQLMGGEKWGNRSITATEARDAGATFDDIVWVASAVARTDKEVERKLRLWMADCAAHVLHIYEEQVPHDMRARAAIIAARQYARGEIDATAMATARDAARDAAWSAARSAARDAAWSAARSAAGDAAWSAAWSAARDAACGAAWHAAKAAARDAAKAAARDAARAAEEQRQFDRLILWLSDEEPEDYPLPELAA